MTVALRSRPRALVVMLVVVLIAGAFVVFAAKPAHAQEPTGASASKDCPVVVATIGDSVTCDFTVENIGFFPADVTSLFDQQPFPGGTPVDVSCTLPDGTTVITVGDTLPPGQPCSGTVVVNIPDDPALCNSLFVDRVEVLLLYPQFQVPLTAGAFATHTIAILCQPEITVTKTASELSKVGDDVTYTIEVCNVGIIPVTRDSVDDTLLGDISGNFDATLAPGACSSATLTRTVLASDPDPLENTVTATYTSGSGFFEREDTATASASTNLFAPGVDVTKSCTPDPVEVGAVETCTIVVTNTSSSDAPNLVNGTIQDTLTGNLLDPANTAVASSNCTAVLPTGGTCTIVTNRTVLDTDPDVLANTVTVHYNPDGFTNNITDTATAQVTVVRPGGQGCTPGFWKQTQHFDSWVGFAPTDSFEAVFGVDVTLRAPGPGHVTIDDPTLLQALQAAGGGVNALARHAVSALLNASNPDVSSDFTTAEVIALVQDAIASGDLATAQALLAAANEQECPLS